MTPEQLYNWAFGVYDREGQYPTVARAAKRFGVKQDSVLSAIEDYQGDNYLGLVVAYRNRVGYADIESQAGYLIEAY